MWSRLNIFVYLNFILYLGVGCIFAELWTRIPIIRGDLILFFLRTTNEYFFLSFIGKNEKHQFALMRELRGNIEWPGVHKLPHYLEYQSSQNRDLQFKNLITDYKICIYERLAINFIDELLTLDPEQRPNVNTAVKSNFLQPKPSSEVLKLLLSNSSNEISHNTIRNIPHETIY